MSMAGSEGPRFKNSRPPFAERTPAAESHIHRLVLFDIDGTLLSAGRAAREAVLSALQRVYGWTPSGTWSASARPAVRAEARRGTSRSPEPLGLDFSGKTDPQIVRELVSEAVGRDRCESGLEQALATYLEEFERRLDADSVVPKPGVAELLDKLSRKPGVVLGLLTGNLERGARLKLEPPGFNRYFPFGAFGSDSSDRYSLPAVAVERAHAHTGRRFEGKSVIVVGDSVHDIACGRSLGLRSVAVATGPTPADRLLGENPDAFFSDFSDVDRALEEILR